MVMGLYDLWLCELVMSCPLQRMTTNASDSTEGGYDSWGSVLGC
jgi:hypothetical protein